MKKYLLSLLTLLAIPSYAGLITHTDYASGNTITAAGQNTNENRIYTEFNGNIDNTNIKTGGIVNSNIAANTIDVTKMTTVFQSSFTNTQSFFSYRRPSLTYNSDTVVNIETGLNGTSGQAAVTFPDGSVRVDTVTTHIQCDVTRTAALTGTAQSGVRVSTASLNTWYAIYAVKSQVNTSDFVLVADTVAPTQGNYATLNTNFGINSWLYLGYVRYGDSDGASAKILKFTQAENLTLFQNIATGNSRNGNGIQLATTNSGVTTLAWTYSSGMTGTNVPPTLTHLIYTGAKSGIVAGNTVQFEDSSSAYEVGEMTGSASSPPLIYRWINVANDGAAVVGNSGANVADIYLSGFIDRALGGSSNPLL